MTRYRSFVPSTGAFIGRKGSTSILPALHLLRHAIRSCCQRIKYANCYHTQRKRKIRTLLQSEIGSDFSCLVGAGGFEPPKLKSSRFTVCPHWPLGNTPIFSFCSPWIACIYYHPDGSLSTSFAEFLDFCAESKSTKAKAAQKSTFLSGFLELVTGVEPATH